MSRGMVASKIQSVPDAQGSVDPEGNSTSIVMARTAHIWRGVWLAARVTRTIQQPGITSFLLEEIRQRGEPVTRPRSVVRWRAHGTTRQEQAHALEVDQGKGDRSRGQRKRGVGGLHTSADVGERKAPGPDRAKAVRVEIELEEGNMPATSMADDKSPELLKVVERAKDPRFTFLALAHLIDEAALTRAYH